MGKLEFNWVFEDVKDEAAYDIAGYRGGLIDLQGLDFSWQNCPDWRKEFHNFKAEALFDWHVTEGAARLSYDPGQERSEAQLIFDDTNNNTRTPLPSINDYLRKGARAGFSWYWQHSGKGEFTDELFAASLPRETSTEKVQELLEAKGLEPAKASSLINWLGDDIVILLHKSEIS